MSGEYCLRGYFLTSKDSDVIDFIDAEEESIKGKSLYGYVFRGFPGYKKRIYAQIVVDSVPFPKNKGRSLGDDTHGIWLPKELRPKIDNKVSFRISSWENITGQLITYMYAEAYVYIG
jgi:hypothetical protein